MATATFSDSRLSIAFDAGVDGEGNAVVTHKSFNNVKTDANNDALYAIVQALAPLQQHEVSTIERDNTLILSA
ncbi:hypothetical protein KBTX_04422 [wastewater metagenome]|uniref:DUF1659 domain-containing protein n=2 Tax=unclassified sequences TaxID=12908 RepID=A0A5B8RK91_9ZZZZ|nr:hypothetical protein KBTEX_04422 [uncultured organism]